MFGNMVRVSAVGALVVSNVLAFAQAQTVGSAAVDSKIATKIKPADLPDDYKAVRLKITGGNGPEDMFSGPMGVFMLMGTTGAGEGNPLTHVLSLLDVSWTKGDIVSLSGHDFLVVYKPDFNVGSLSSTSKSPPNLDLYLNYVRVDTITSIAPRPEMTKAMLMSAAPPPEAGTTAPSAPVGDPKATTISNAKQAATGMLMYCQDYDDYLPYVQDTRSAYYVTSPYVKNLNTFKTLNPKGGILKFNMSIAGVIASAIDAPADTPMYYDTNAWPDGTRVVAFVDGHVKAVSPDEWAKIQPYLNLKIKRNIKPLPPGYGSGLGGKPGG